MFQGETQMLQAAAQMFQAEGAKVSGPGSNVSGQAQMFQARLKASLEAHVCSHVLAFSGSTIPDVSTGDCVVGA
eukprot:2140359-Rhodomonas_salina.1